MPAKINSWFNSGRSWGEQNERSLYQGMVDEVVQIYGMAVSYIRRSNNAAWDKIKTWIEFPDRFYDFVDTIEMYLEDKRDFAGAGFLSARYGLELDQEVKFTVSAARWDEFHKTAPERIPYRPQAGDLIFVNIGSPHNNFLSDGPKLFEITYVPVEPSNQMLRGQYVYTLTCKLFEIASEDFNIAGMNETVPVPEPETDIIDEEEKLEALDGKGSETIAEENNIKEVVHKIASNRDIETSAAGIVTEDLTGPFLIGKTVQEIFEPELFSANVTPTQDPTPSNDFMSGW